MNLLNKNSYKVAKSDYIFQKSFKAYMLKIKKYVPNQCNFTGEYRNAAHNKFSLRYLYI